MSASARACVCIIVPNKSRLIIIISFTEKTKTPVTKHQLNYMRGAAVYIYICDYITGTVVMVSPTVRVCAVRGRFGNVPKTLRIIQRPLVTRVRDLWHSRPKETMAHFVRQTTYHP